MLFATKGYAATGTADIAREADVSEGSIFYHFGSKRNLLADIGRMYGESMIAAMQQGDALEDLEPGIIIRRVFDFVVAHREWEKLTDNDCAPSPSGKPKMLNAEAEPFYLASRDVICEWNARQHAAAVAKHGGPKNINVNIAAQLTYGAVNKAIESVMTTEDQAMREAIINETVRFVRAAYGYGDDGKLLPCV